MNIAKDSVVSMDYTLTDAAGQVIDTSKGRGPLTYLHGSGQIIDGLESALTGKKAGDSLKVTVAPDQGYGQVNPALIQGVPRSAFQGIDKIEVGMQFRAEGPHGPQIVRVTKVEAETVTVDANHALAGQTLNFDVTVTSVRAASAEEIAHKHVHGAGGHHH